jgi:rare lipoprotein A (peptidoglycan hydrolase)
MKRIVPILLIFFVVFLILNNFLIAVASSNEKTMVTIDLNQSATLEDTIIKNDTINIVSDTLKNIKDNKKQEIKNDGELHSATWYRTEGHPIVHRSHPTAAYNNYPKGTKLMVTNIDSGDTCVVEVTDVMGCRLRCWKKPETKCIVHDNKIDLSHHAFGKIGNHSRGRIRVKVQKM